MSLSEVGRPADLNADHLVDCRDLLLLSAKWLSEQILAKEDLDANGVIDGHDVAVFAMDWRATDLANGTLPVAHWTFDEGTGAIAHDAVGDNHGTIHGATWMYGLIEGALRFDGENDFVDCGSSDLLVPGQLTIAFWVHCEGRVSYNYILGKAQNLGVARDYSFITDAQDRLQFNFGDGFGRALSLTSGARLVEGQWTLIAVTRDGSQASLYVNDSLEDSAAYSFAPTPLGHMLRIGSVGSSSGWAGYFLGVIDDVRIYDRALDADEVTQLYYNSSP